MSLPDLLHGSAFCGLIVSALPLLIGIVGFGGRSPGYRLLWGWLGVGFATNLIMMQMGGQGQRTALVLQVAYPVLAVMGMLAVAELTASRLLRKACHTAGMGYLVFWGWRLLHLEAAGDFSVYSGPVLWVMLSAAATAAIWVRLAGSPAAPLRDPTVIAALAILISFAPGAALEAVSASLYSSHRDFTVALWIGKSWLMILGSILFTLAFLWTLPSRPSRGSTSSAAPVSG